MRNVTRKNYIAKEVAWKKKRDIQQDKCNNVDKMIKKEGIVENEKIKEEIRDFQRNVKRKKKKTDGNIEI